ncbi:MAG: hypothetical protein HKL90_07590 [Elusimicrobia bacterium]|nr:hypothetical protein [Elusimicrobiota bacterium]
MNKILIVAAAMTALLWTGAARADDPTFPADNGPDSIDVSKYPKDQQENYKVFSEKCSRCHTLARPINTSVAAPEDWKATVEKMRRKPRSGISDDAQKQIADFLIYNAGQKKVAASTSAGQKSVANPSAAQTDAKAVSAGAGAKN